MVKGAAVLWVTWLSNITDWASVPLAMSVGMSMMVTLNACFSVSGMSARKWTIYRYCKVPEV